MTLNAPKHASVHPMHRSIGYLVLFHIIPAALEVITLFFRRNEEEEEIVLIVQIFGRYREFIEIGILDLVSVLFHELLDAYELPELGIFVFL